MELFLLSLLTIIATIVGTVTGFGTSTVMVPVLIFWYPLPAVLFFVAIIHWFGDLWRIMLFRRGFNWKLVFTFGIPGMILTWFGASLVFTIPAASISRVVGCLILAYALFLLLYPAFKLRRSVSTAAIGGAISGFLAGISGVGGGVRSAVLSAFDLEKAAYIATGGAIGLAIDSARIVEYWHEGATFGSLPAWSLLVLIPLSYMAAEIGKRVVNTIPQRLFRTIIAVFLVIVSIKLVLMP